MTRRPKAHKLPESTQEKIGREYVEGKASGRRTSYNAIAKKFNCTPEQVRSYAELFRSGAFSGKRGARKPRNKSVTSDDVATTDPLKAIDDQITTAVIELSNSEVTVIERVSLLDRIVSTKKTLQQVTLVGHLKNADAEFILQLIRRFVPGVTDEEAIKIYREERARWEAFQ